MSSFSFQKLLIFCGVWSVAFAVGAGMGISWEKETDNSGKNTQGKQKAGNPAVGALPAEGRNKASFEERRWNKYRNMPLEDIPGELIFQADRCNDDPLALYILFSRLARSSPQTALNYINFFYEVDASAYRRFVFSKWASRDPENAAVCYLERSDEFKIWSTHFYSVVLDIVCICESQTYFGGNGLREISEAWATLDPAQSLEWIKSLSSEDPEDAWDGYIRGLVSKDPRLAVKVLKDIPEKFLDSVYWGLASSWALQDWNGALNWINSFEKADVRERLLRAAIHSLAGKDSNQAALFSEAVKSEDSSFDIYRSFVNMEQCAGWIKTRPESKQRMDNVFDLLATWDRIDSKSARGWLDALPAGQERDAGISSVCGGQGIVFGLGTISPYRHLEYLSEDEARPYLSLAMSSSSSAARLNALKVPLTGWARHDSAEVLRWLEDSSLTREEKSEIKSVILEKFKEGY